MAGARTEGDYLNNDDLIRDQSVFAIIDVVEDRGGGFGGNDRWVVKVIPYDDQDEAPDGLITLSDNAARRKFMLVLQDELDNLEKAGDNVEIGPCTLVRLKGRSNFYYEIVDWDLERKAPMLPDGAQLAGQRMEEEMRPRRPRSDGRARTKEEPEQRPFAEAVEAKAEASPAKKAAKPAAAPVTGEFPPIKIWAKEHGYEVPEGRGRVKAEIKKAYERAKEDAGLYGQDVAGDNHVAPAKPKEVDNIVPMRRAQQAKVVDLPQEPVRRARTTPERPAEVPPTAPSRPAIPPEGGAQRASEIVFRAGMTGTSQKPCPGCGETIHERIFPTGTPGEFALLHDCPAGEPVPLPATPDAG